MTRFALVLLLAALTPGCTCSHIDAGNVGIEVDSCSGGGVKPTPVGVGYQFAGWCTDYVEYPTYQQTLILTKQEGEGSKNDESITVTSNEGLPISADVSLSFTVDPTMAPKIYQKYRKDLDHIMKTYMRQSIRESMQETFAKYTAQQLYSDKREISRGEVQRLVTDRFVVDGFIVTQFTVNETRIPAEVEAAIRGKVAMVQEAQRAEQQVKKTEAEARQAVAQARGQAQAYAEGEAAVTKLRAEAQAAANKVISESVTPQLIEYEKAKRWNGALPTMMGGNTTPMIMVK